MGQLVEMKLQAELVEVCQRDFAERLNEIELDKELLCLSRLGFPDSLFEGKEPVGYKPFERYRTIVQDPRRRPRLSQLFCDLAFQSPPGFRLRHR